jgi:hypothetical protein
MFSLPVSHLCVCFIVFDQTKYQTVDIIKGRIPLLPHVTHLAVDIKLWERHSTGPGVACLLTQCSNIKHLSLQLCYIIKKVRKMFFH